MRTDKKKKKSNVNVNAISPMLLRVTVCPAISKNTKFPTNAGVRVALMPEVTV